MSCASCHSGRQRSCCEQAPSIGGHSAPPQLNKAQLARSSCHVCSPPINCCCSYGCISQTTPLKTGETNYGGGCLCQSSVAHPPEHHVCSPSPHSHHHHAHHHHPHQPAVASPLLYSHHCPHQPLQTTPTEHCHAHTAKFHPDPSPLCQSISHVRQGGSAICLSKTHLPIDGPPPFYHSASHPSLEPSPLSRPHPRPQLHPTSASCGVRPHPALREKLFTPESGRSSSSSKPLPPSLEFSPGDSECTPPVSTGFHLGGATEVSPASDITSSPRKSSSLSTITKQAPQPPVVVTDNEVVASRSVQGDVEVPTTGGSVASEPEIKVLDVKSTPQAKAAGGHGSAAKARSPILLYRWCFKVLPKGMVILLGFKSQDCDELKWRSGPVSERLSSTLLMTRSGQLYHLMGPLCRNEIEKEYPGLNQPTIKKFKRGFPSEWQDLLCNQKPLHVEDSKDGCFKKPATPELAGEQQQQQECEEKKPTSSGNHSDGAGAPIKRRIKKEVPDDPLVMLTPLLSDSDMSTPGSGFANSQNVKRSSRGRIIKPARSTISPYLTNCNDLYTYDWHGNFQGVNSAVIDLTLCDDPLPTKKGIKKEPGASKNLDHINTSVANGNTTTLPTDALSTTAPAKKRQGRSRKVKVCNEIPVQTSEVCVSELDTDHNGSEVRQNGRKITNFSSSDFGVASESERLKEDKRSKTKKPTTSTVNRSSTVAAVIGSESDSETRRRTREAAPRGGQKREKSERTSRKRTTSSGGSASGDGRRERTASGGSRDSDVVLSDDHTRQQGRGGNGKGSKKRKRTVSGGKKVQHTSSAGGKEKGRGVSRVLLSSEGESEGEGNSKNRQRPRKNIHSKNRKLYISESETGSDQSESDAANEKGQPTSVVTIRQHPVDAFSPLLSPAKKMVGWRDGAEESKVMARVHLGDPRDSKMTQNELHKKNGEHRPSKMAAVSASDTMDAFSPLLSPVKKKKSMLRGRGAGEREVCISSTTITGALSEPVDDLMTRSQLRSLRQVVHGVPALTTNFWEVVARQMNTGHTAHQCSSAYHEQSRRSRMKPSSSSSHHRQPTGSKEKTKAAPPASSAAASVTAKPKVTKVTGGAGTLKRKRQLRDALEEMDNGYYDDVFESTPFKKFKTSVMIPEQEDDSFEGGEDSSLEGEEGSAPKSASHCYTPSTAQSRVGAPISHTPNLCDYLTTPDLKSGLKRNVADHVIYKAQKAYRQGGGGGVKKSVSFQKPLVASSGGVSKSRSKPCVFEEKLRNIRTGELTTLRMFEDSDDSSSSEDADPFDDILTTLVP